MKQDGEPVDAGRLGEPTNQHACAHRYHSPTTIPESVCLSASFIVRATRDPSFAMDETNQSDLHVKVQNIG